MEVTLRPRLRAEPFCGFSPDGRDVASGGGEAATRRWNRTNVQLARNFTGHPAGTMAAMFSSDGTRILIIWDIPHVAQLWNPETGQLEREFAGHNGWLLAAAFSADGLRVVTGAQDGTARLWDVTTGLQVRAFTIQNT